jgi:hypothetical protein
VNLLFSRKKVACLLVCSSTADSILKSLQGILDPQAPTLQYEHVIDVQRGALNKAVQMDRDGYRSAHADIIAQREVYGSENFFVL